MIVAAGALYLRPAPAIQPRTPTLTIDPFLVSYNPVTYAFVTPSMGWASLEVAGLSGPGEFRVFRTTDSARHWRMQLSGQSDYGPGFEPLAVQFFGKRGGFMTVGEPVERLYHTGDGGDRWDPLVLPALRVDSLTFSDATHGWAVGYIGTRLPPSQAQIYATLDAGQNWQPLPDPPSDGGIVSFRSPTEAWMGSVDPLLPHVYTSGDGGQSWRRHDLPRAAGSFPDDRYFETTIELLPGSGAIATVEAFRCMVAPVPIAGPTPAPTPSCGNTISETFLFTSLDGTTWRQLPSPPGFIVYQDPVHWWAMSSNAVFKSADAGRTWRQVAAIPASLQFSSVTILDSKHAWASMFAMGGYGLALTSDGGLHWTLARVPAPA
jgi:hypothetical protein